jgi:hypothetical protein
MDTGASQERRVLRASQVEWMCAYAHICTHHSKITNNILHIVAYLTCVIPIFKLML